MNIHLADVLQAKRLLYGRIVRTPLVQSLALSEAANAEIWLKPEHWQITGSFKVRGAYCRMARLTPEERRLGVITASAGNHALGVAWSARQLAMSALVVVPESAPEAKVSGIRRLGAEITAAGAHYDDAERVARRLAQDTGRIFIHAYEDDDVAAGQGTVGLEMLEDEPQLDLLVVPSGGGGLICGVAAAAKAINPGIEVIGVQSEASPAWHAAWHAGRVVDVIYQETWAEGLLGAIGRENFAFARRVVSDFALVSERDIRRAMRWAVDHHHWIVEGSGAVGLAWALNQGEALQNRRVGIVVTGGNLDTERLGRLVALS